MTFPYPWSKEPGRTRQFTAQGAANWQTYAIPQGANFLEILVGGGGGGGGAGFTAAAAAAPETKNGPDSLTVHSAPGVRPGHQRVLRPVPPGRDAACPALVLAPKQRRHERHSQASHIP